MSWPPDALGGPVLAWEIKRVARRRLWRFLQFGYCAWLFIHAAAFLGNVPSHLPVRPEDSYSRREAYGLLYTQQLEFLENYQATVLQFQLVLVVALVPALTASSLGQEKERGALFALFGTDLTSRQVLLGKRLGRLMLAVPLVLMPLPALVFIARFTERGLASLVPALVQEATMAFALGSASLLFGIWLRRTTDAVVAAYAVLGGAYLVLRAYAAPLKYMFWFDPVDNLNEVLHRGSGVMFRAHLAVWAFFGLACLRIGWGHLRKVCVEQQDQRPSRRLWAFRPAIGDNPIRWREVHVIGLAPLPVLRIVPRWLALLAVASASAAIAGMLGSYFAPGSMHALMRLDFTHASQELKSRGEDVGACVFYMGFLFVLAADLLVAVRCATSVSEEKRRNTWDDLLLTAQSFREITSGKMWGILQATVPYIMAYALPVFFLAWLGGPRALIAASMWIILPSAAVYVAALRGIDMLRVPAHMDETRADGAFWFEKNLQRMNPHRSSRVWGPLRYQVVISWSVAEQVFVAQVPELPAFVVARGRTYEEAAANIEVVMRDWVESLQALAQRKDAE
jgi:predicted RNase H-like HicB family nuclease/ABC-type transport system involved in multi-copper enzyme maturation permease subunit